MALGVGSVQGLELCVACESCSEEQAPLLSLNTDISLCTQLRCWTVPGWVLSGPVRVGNSLGGVAWVAQLLPLFLRELCRLCCHLLRPEEEGESGVFAWGCAVTVACARLEESKSSLSHRANAHCLLRPLSFPCSGPLPDGCFVLSHFSPTEAPLQSYRIG